MNNLSLIKRFGLISLNGIQESQNTIASRLRNQCFASAKLLDFILEGIISEANNKYNFVDCSDYHFSNADKILYDFLRHKNSEDSTIADWMKIIDTIPQKLCIQISEEVIDDLKNSGLLDNIPSLLECDLNYQTSEVKVRQYRSSYTLYHSEIEYMKAELLENGIISDEVISLIWLFKQSGDIQFIFSSEELYTVQEVVNNLYRENHFAHNLFDASIGTEISRSWKSLLSNKKKFSKTQFGSGIVFKIPAIQKDESIFIESTNMFSDAHERLVDVKNRLESTGHICEVKSEGKVSLVEIDNTLYELIPDAIRVMFLNIHGVRLRRYLV